MWSHPVRRAKMLRGFTPLHLPSMKEPGRNREGLLVFHYSLLQKDRYYHSHLTSLEMKVSGTLSAITETPLEFCSGRFVQGIRLQYAH